MRKFLFLPLLLLLASCAKDDDCSPANVNPDNLVSPALYATLEQHSTDPYTGPLEVLPCQPDGSIYVGNYTPTGRQVPFPRLLCHQQWYRPVKELSVKASGRYL